MGFLNLLKCKSLAKEAIGHTVTLANFLCGLHLTDTHICTSVIVFGQSMSPALNAQGDVVLVDKISHKLGKLVPGDIVIVQSPDDPTKSVPKRILGMEGDRVTFLVDPAHSYRTMSTVVPKGHVWIQGDNIYASRDSCSFGPVPYGLIQGKAFYRLWPLMDFGSLNQGLWK